MRNSKNSSGNGRRRVVLTGMGTVSPFGYGSDVLFDALLDGRSSVRSMDSWDEYEGLRSHVAAPCDIRGEKDIPRKARRSMSPMGIMAAQAADMALSMSGLPSDIVVSGRCGCVVGSTMGSAKITNEAFELVLPGKDFSKVTSMMFFKTMAHSCSANLAGYLGLKGMVLATSAACASGLQAIGTGFDMIRLGRQDAMLCGGAEEIHPTVTGIFDLLYAASTAYNEEPSKTPRPFDAERDGLVCGEGAGILLLESLESAKARGAEILAEILGYETTASGDHVGQSSPEAMTRCVKGALRDAGTAPEEVDYVNAHATATLQGDAAEAEAIRRVFGAAVPVSSLKGHIGHTLGASGALELVASVEMIRRNAIVPTLNLEEVAADCAGINLPKEPLLDARLRRVVKNSFAFGGVNASIVVAPFES